MLWVNYVKSTAKYWTCPRNGSGLDEKVFKTIIIICGWKLLELVKIRFLGGNFCVRCHAPKEKKLSQNHQICESFLLNFN